MTNAPFLLDQQDAVVVISINDAPWNKMSVAFMDELEVLVERLTVDDSVRAIVITGEGDKNFSVGMDLKEFPKVLKERGGRDGFFDQRKRVLGAIENMGKPWIATLFGYCLGGGLEIPLACHIRLAAEEGAQIGLPEMDLGAVPAWGGSARLPRVVGRTHATDMILRGKKISGPEAYRIGLANEVWPLSALKAQAIKLAHELAAQPRLSVKAMLGCLVGCESKTLEESLAEERAAALMCADSPDQQEGRRAFLEKRQPVFNQA